MVFAEHSLPPEPSPLHKARFEEGALAGETRLIKRTPATIGHVQKSRSRLYGSEMRVHSTQTVVGHGRGINPEDPLIEPYVKHVISEPDLQDTQRVDVARALERLLPEDELEALVQPFLVVEERVYYRYRVSHMQGDVTVYRLVAGPVPLNFNDTTNTWDEIEEPDDA